MNIVSRLAHAGKRSTAASSNSGGQCLAPAGTVRSGLDTPDAAAMGKVGPQLNAMVGSLGCVPPSFPLPRPAQ